MNTVYSKERKRLLIRFGIFFAISLGLASLIISSIYNYSSARPGMSVFPGDGNFSGEQELLFRHSNALEASQKLLQGYDEEYYHLSATSPRSPSIVELIEKIKMTEKVLSTRIIALKNEKTGFQSANHVLLADKIISFNLLAIKGRANIAIFRSSMANRDDQVTADPALKLKWTSEIAEKDQKIVRLEQELSDIKLSGDLEKPAAGLLTTENETLKLSVSESVKKLQTATEATQGLKKENARLSTLVGQLQNTLTQNRNPIRERNETELLNAELTLAQVDCNLTRADAKQIIFNARQRRDLLNEAMRNLNTLAKSDNAEIRQKANEKIAALNYISKNIRE